jgi:NAD(P)-dependent dehydrogenase (short-subunit alcohol dehydrogenase family)
LRATARKACEIVAIVDLGISSRRCRWGETVTFDLSGRTALITGASSGIGERFARQMAAAGARVALCARRATRLEGLAASIVDAGGTATAVAMDVTDEASVIRGFDEAQSRLGPIDTVVANAGMNNRALAADIAVDAWDEVMAVNVRGVFLTAREGARRMMAAGSRDSGRGRVILIASIGAQKVLPGLTAYCTSKAAVAMMGRSLAREWANRGINVNVLCPGYARTELNADWFDEAGGKAQIAGFPRRRLMDVSDLDAMALYLASDASRAITGSVFTLDDGQSL